MDEILQLLMCINIFIYYFAFIKFSKAKIHNLIESNALTFLKSFKLIFR